MEADDEEVEEADTGFVVQAHGINNTFHAFTLLQIMMGEHAQQPSMTIKRYLTPEEVTLYLA